MDRKLDGCFFRVQRDGKYQPICFSDLTEDERDEILKNRTPEWLSSLCCHLADVIKEIGEQFGIVGGDEV